MNEAERLYEQYQRDLEWFPEGELKQGDGRWVPLGSWYCQACSGETGLTAEGRKS
jgi:hypothetical protein